MRTETAWPSLADQVALADELFGGRGRALVDDWLEQQCALVGDRDFADLFATHLDLPGVVAADYSHRQVHGRRGDLIGGIRFRNRDPRRPFVEVIAHDFDDLAALAECVRDEWSMFAPAFLRLRGAPGSVTGPGVVLDHSVHVARYDRMTPPDGRVTLGRFAGDADAAALLDARYAALRRDEPGLAADVPPADAADLGRWRIEGRLRAIRHGDVTVGALAIVAGAIGWIAGDEIHEEVIATEYAGHGYAASAQTAWAGATAADPGRHLVGMIDQRNHASRRTALRAGRPEVLHDVFVALQ